MTAAAAELDSALAGEDRLRLPLRRSGVLALAACAVGLGLLTLVIGVPAGTDLTILMTTGLIQVALATSAPRCRDVKLAVYGVLWAWLLGGAALLLLVRHVPAALLIPVLSILLVWPWTRYSWLVRRRPRGRWNRQPLLVLLAAIVAFAAMRYEISQRFAG